jgi:hypothetical protein
MSHQMQHMNQVDKLVCQRDPTSISSVDAMGSTG